MQMPLATYRTADGTVKTIEWDEGRFVVDGAELALADLLAWDAAGSLSWVSPETQAWARSLAPQLDSQEPVPAQTQAQAAAAAQPDARLALLADILATFAQYPGYTAQYGTDTDITIDNKVAQANWGTGKKRIDYTAHLKAIEAERVVYFFEMLKEQGSGLSFGGFESESFTTVGKKRSGTTKEIVMGPGGVAMDATWDYGQTRAIVESVCVRHGWVLKVVLRPGSAKY